MPLADGACAECQPVVVPEDTVNPNARIALDDVLHGFFSILSLPSGNV